MGRHLEALHQFYDGALTQEVRQVAINADLAEARAAKRQHRAPSADELAAEAAQYKFDDANRDARFHATFAIRARAKLRGAGRVGGNDWFPVFAKANRARRFARNALAEINARIDAASARTFYAAAAE